MHEKKSTKNKTIVVFAYFVTVVVFAKRLIYNINLKVILIYKQHFTAVAAQCE